MPGTCCGGGFRVDEGRGGTVGRAGAVPGHYGTGRLRGFHGATMRPPCTTAGTRRPGMGAEPAPVNLDPAWAPGAPAIAFAHASSKPPPGTGQAALKAWYATRQLWSQPRGPVPASRPRSGPPPGSTSSTSATTPSGSSACSPRPEPPPWVLRPASSAGSSPARGPTTMATSPGKPSSPGMPDRTRIRRLPGPTAAPAPGRLPSRRARALPARPGRRQRHRHRHAPGGRAAEQALTLRLRSDARRLHDRPAPRSGPGRRPDVGRRPGAPQTSASMPRSRPWPITWPAGTESGSRPAPRSTPTTSSCFWL